MHGARGGAPRDEAHGNYRHGARTKDVEEVRKLANLLVRLSKAAEEV